MTEIKKAVTEHALELGFDLVRVTSAQEFAEDRSVALERLTAGLMDGLPWYHSARVLRGTDPQQLLPGARSVICLGLGYYVPHHSQPTTKKHAGKVARYARVRDYHRVMKQRMRDYVKGLSLRLGIPIAARWYVDDGPMLDRAAARRSGLGWFGKNTNILTPSHGSWVFLAQVVTDLEIEPDPPLQKTCGTCARCIDACPTGAIVAPYVIDNTRCIAYLTIENPGAIPGELRPRMLDWVFGCDICQEICPVNRKALPSNSPLWQEERVPLGLPQNRSKREDAPKEALGTLDLVDLLELSEEEFRRRFRGSPILRTGRKGLKRNACVALGNLEDGAAVPSLGRVLAQDEPLVRGHAAWALGRIGTSKARQALERVALEESDQDVLGEITAALAETGNAGAAPSG